MKDIFSIILPNSDYSSDKTVALFTYKLKNAETLQSMNSALQATLQTLLSVPESDTYSHLYRSRLNESISAAVLKASNENKTADLLPLFASFPELSARAKAKDEIRDILLGSASVSDKILIKIENDFNSENGLVDLTPKEILSLEITRASTAKRCFEEYSDTLNELEVVLLPYGYSGFSERARLCFESFLEKLYAIEGYAGFDESCTSLMGGTERELSGILCEAKAERFLLDHKDIIGKSPENLSAKDELALRRALSDYSELEENVRASLVSQINSIAEKYNYVLSQAIRSKLSDDSLYLDLCENLCKELQSLSKINIAEYYNNCDQVLKKSESLVSLITAYRALCSDELYSSFNAGEREALIVICRESAESIFSTDVNDKAIFESELSDILEDSKIKMSRVNEIVRIRVAARSSENTQIKALVSETNAKINASYDRSEMTAIADKAIFKINRLLTVDAIEASGEEKKYSVNDMEFLTADEKSSLATAIDSLKSSHLENAKIAENLTVLGFIWNTFEEKLEEIYLSANEKNLNRSKEEHIYLLEKEIDKLSADIRSMVHLSTLKRDEYLNKSNQLLVSFKAKLVVYNTDKEVKSLYKESLENLSSIRVSASGENLENYKIVLAGELDILKKLKDNYSAENYNKVLLAIENARKSLEAAGSISACNEIFENVKKQIDDISDLLDDAKQDAITKLEALASTYRSQTELYSSTALSAIEQILSEGKRRITSFTEISEIPTLKTELEERLTSLRSVKKDYLTTAPGGLSFTAEGAEYPLQYDFSAGYWGLLHSKDSLPADAILSIGNLDLSNASEIQKLIRRAAKDGSIKYYGSPLTSSEKNLIKGGVIALGFDINIGTAAFPDAPVTLQMLLPSSVKDENVIGVAFVGEDDCVEFYSIEQRSQLISMPLEHFSSYYIVVENTINLLPVIVLLTVIIILEFLVFAFLIFIRANRKRKENSNMLPMLSAYLVTPFPVISASRVRPSGAVGATILLSVAALALGCGIALLVRAELRESAERKAQPTQRKRKDPERVADTPRLRSAERSLLKAKVYELDSPKERTDADEEYFNEGASEQEKIPCPVGADSEDEISEVSYDFRDEDASFPKHRRHRFEINLDIIANSFEAGELVTLEALKRRNIAPKRADHLKILARGALSKPLIIEAHEFTHAAEEMLKAVGGEAIRIRH